MVINGITLNVVKSFTYHGRTVEGYSPNPHIEAGTPLYELASPGGRYRLVIPATQLLSLDESGRA